MCDIAGENSADLKSVDVVAPEWKTAVQDLLAKNRSQWTALDVAGVIVLYPENRAPQVGFVGYGDTKHGDKVLIGLDSWYDPEVASVFQEVLRDRGASVDVATAEFGANRRARNTDEIDAFLRDVPWTTHPRRGDSVPWIVELASEQKYDLLLHGKGGPTPGSDHRYEQFPWFQLDHLVQGAGAFPLDLHQMINRKTWDKIWRQGRGGRVHLTDPEGTDISWTMHEEYFTGDRRGFTSDPVRHYGHLHGHPVQPILEKDDTTGTIAGTTSHFGNPFPNIQLHIENGRLESIDGGGQYGDGWRQALERSRDTQYPSFPRPGLFWLWECAIGTNPWVRRPPHIDLVSSGSFEWERRRAGVIHIGIGTRWKDEQEKWAAERGLLYGHLHCHLLFPTYKILTVAGDEILVIENGRLTALDDPDVRALASTYGDPAALLDDIWVPDVPGITAPGRYADFAKNPAKWIYRNA